MHLSRRRFMLTAAGTTALLAVPWLRNARGLFEQTGRRLVRGSAQALGTQVTITALHTDELVARAGIAAALGQVVAVDRLMSLYRADSQLSQLNRWGRLDDPHPAVVAVLRHAQDVAERSGGAFDVTVQPLWDVAMRARLAGTLALQAQIEQARHRVDWRRLVVDTGRLRLVEGGMAVTLNGIAQGYATDRALAALRSHGIAHALVDAGEIGTLGTNVEQQAWRIGIEHPRAPAALLGALSSDGRAVATSADYATTFSDDYAQNHIFDPATGASPLELASVTVLAASATEADALATAVFVLGVERGLALLARTPHTDAILVRKDGSVLHTAAAPPFV